LEAPAHSTHPVVVHCSGRSQKHDRPFPVSSSSHSSTSLSCLVQFKEVKDSHRFYNEPPSNQAARRHSAHDAQEGKQPTTGPSHSGTELNALALRMSFKAQIYTISTLALALYYRTPQTTKLYLFVVTWCVPWRHRDVLRANRRYRAHTKQHGLSGGSI